MSPFTFQCYECKCDILDGQPLYLANDYTYCSATCRAGGWRQNYIVRPSIIASDIISTTTTDTTTTTTSTTTSTTDADHVGFSTIQTLAQFCADGVTIK